MEPQGHLADLERKPEVLLKLADAVEAGDVLAGVPDDVDRVLLLGMGSSTYAAGVAAARLRSRGVDAVAELASSDLLPAADPRTLVVAISATGGSAETIAAARPYVGRSPVIAVTNVVQSPITVGATSVVNLRAEPEVGGVACRSFQNTLALLLALEHLLVGSEPDLAATLRTAARACADLLQRRGEWLATVTEALAGPDGTWLVAPFRRLSSAQQGALMLREGPRRPAVACETGDWSHVDVYLTKSLDYRLLLFPGSGYEDELLKWTRERGSTVIAVGDDIPAATYCLRYPGDTEDDVRLLTEVLVAELVAQRLWSASVSGPKP
ncbi:MAG TPA: SIS domain-containing protein [Actinomycetes bacterium]|nr:SIS domain-containing protein [Actinomycetes bacterium]